jgi:hypothetical protein
MLFYLIKDSNKYININIVVFISRYYSSLRDNNRVKKPKGGMLIPIIEAQQ